MVHAHISVMGLRTDTALRQQPASEVREGTLILACAINSSSTMPSKAQNRCSLANVTKTTACMEQKREAH